MASTAPAPSGTIDFARSFTFFQEESDWLKKVLIGGGFTLLSALLVGIPFVLGYFGRVLKNAAAGAARPLPEWDDLGGLFSEGLRLTGVYLVYALGTGLVVAAPGCLLMLPAMLASGSDHASEAVAPLAALAVFAFYGLGILFSLALMVYLPAALTRVVVRGTMADGFAFRAIIGFIRANLGNYLLALLTYLVAAFVAQFGFILCCVGFFPAAFASQLVLAVSLGQVVRLNPGSLA
jgi:hypothetical protein